MTGQGCAECRRGRVREICAEDCVPSSMGHAGEAQVRVTSSPFRSAAHAICSAMFVLAVAGCGKPMAQLDQQISALKSAVGGDENKADETLSLADVFTNSIGMEFSRVPGGTFMMGNADPSQFGPYSRGEAPQHKVHLTNPLWVGRHEVTVGQFREFVKKSGYLTECERGEAEANGLIAETGEIVSDPELNWTNPGFEQDDRHPVVCVTWADAQAFCSWLSLQEGRRYRLPTEAEWEYACRGGTDTLFWTGQWPATLEGAANLADEALKNEYAKAEGCSPWYDGHAFTAPVGSFTANFFGLYDVHGNVGEWCQDWYSAGFYEYSPLKDPSGPDRATLWRVVRSGSWYNNPMSSRSSGRHDGIPTACSTTNGFRVVIDVDDKSEEKRKSPWAPDPKQLP